ncbi:MAG: hypothetical protein HKN47_14195 [Pirellulaceae bacterium]|nr:hypothetical protein [Pirellulaceae bacterium]
MRYAVLFLLLGAILAYVSRTGGQLNLLALWPAACCIAVSISYFFYSPAIFGKLRSGRLNPISVVLLLPYLTFTWLVWHLVRLLTRENAYDRLDERTTIGRRLLGSEFPAGIANVVDLTAEFAEPRRIVSNSNYVTFPILDASIVSPSELTDIVSKIDEFEGSTYIHCAQGHGRTGFVTAALLIHRDPMLTVDDAIREIQRNRPALACNQNQIMTLKKWRSAG